MMEEQQKASADIAVRYPLCMKSEKCGRRCAARVEFFASVKRHFLKDELFTPVFFDGCGDYRKEKEKE